MSKYVQYDDLNTVLTGYATAIKNRVIQYSTMPTAVAKDVDRIVQYVGETNTNYTNGLFYKGIEDTTSGSSVYSWEEVPTQDVSAKADKVDNATNGHLAGLDANGNLTDSGTDPTTLQSKTLDTPLTIDGISATTVEGALGTLNTKKAPVNHTHDYLPLSGGTMTGAINGVKLGTSGSSYGYYDANGNFKSFRQPTGNATAAQVVSGYTFSNASSDSLKGTFAAQEKTVTAGTSAASVTPDSGKYLSKVTYNPTPSQSKSASPSTSAQTISPDSGKLLSSVSISAISPQRSTGTAASAAGRDSAGPYVYFPYGWWPNYSSSRNYTRLTEAQGIAVARTQEKTVTGSRSAQTVTPDSNYLLSKVTVNKYPDASGTFTTSTSSSAVDMGATNNYRYVNTTGVYNAGYAAGDAAGKKESKFYGRLEWEGTSSNKPFTYTGLKAGGRYFFTAFVQQTGGTYSGVGSGATVDIPSATIDGTATWTQKEARSDQTSGSGGMVMSTDQAFTLSSSSTSVTIYLKTVTNITGYWVIYLWGNY